MALEKLLEMVQYSERELNQMVHTRAACMDHAGKTSDERDLCTGDTGLFLGANRLSSAGDVRCQPRVASR